MIWRDLAPTGATAKKSYSVGRFQGCQGFTEPDLSTLRYKIISVKEVIVKDKSIFYSAKNQIICLDLSNQVQFESFVEAFLHDRSGINDRSVGEKLPAFKTKFYFIGFYLTSSSVRPGKNGKNYKSLKFC